MYQLDDYDFDLPEELIAQQPAARREAARLLTVNRYSGQVHHQKFTDICHFLKSGDTLVVNNTQVVPARLMGKKQTGGKVEVLIINYAEGMMNSPGPGRVSCQCMIKAAKRPRAGTRIDFESGLSARVVDFHNGVFSVDFSCDGSFEEIIYAIGRVPLPPYIKRTAESAQKNADDVAAYQTVYASEKGAAAAPTAGLHFSKALLARIRRQGVRVVPITLHVGYGTFAPVRVSDIRDHQMHSENYVVPPETADAVNQAKAAGTRVVAVGTTSIRTLEYVADEHGRIRPGSGHSDLFIYPGYRFKTVDAMITNFHLPRSTLLMLVSAFAGKERVLSAYAEAVRKKYRFFSYGDAMFIA